jgi:uncharacterized protein (DUF58 family)
MRPPRQLRVTRSGRIYLSVTVGVGLGALNTGNNLLYLVLGIGLAIVVASGVLSERCLRDLEVRRLGAEAAHAREPFAFRWALSRRRGTAFALTVVEEGLSGGLAAEGRVAVLPPGRECVVRADLTAPARGPVALTGVRVTTTFPLGLFAKTRTFEAPGALLVYPARTPPTDAEEQGAPGPAGQGGDPMRGDGTADLHGLRELAEGEDVRRVHWLKSAASGRLLRVEREREDRRTVVLAVDTGLREAALERHCEQLAARAQRLITEGSEVGLSAGAYALRPAAGSGQLRRILGALALVGHRDLHGTDGTDGMDGMDRMDGGPARSPRGEAA